MTAFARSYAQAFLQTAAPGYDVERFLEGAGSVRDALSGDPRLRSFFLSPSVPLAAKKGTLALLCGKAGVDAFGARRARSVRQRDQWRRWFDLHANIVVDIRQCHVRQRRTLRNERSPVARTRRRAGRINGRHPRHRSSDRCPVVLRWPLDLDRPERNLAHRDRQWQNRDSRSE